MLGEQVCSQQFNYTKYNICHVRIQYDLERDSKMALFDVFSEEEKEQLATVGSIKNFKKDEFLFSFEDKGDAFLLSYLAH